MSDKKYAAESQQFGQAMNSIAYGETMMAAVRNYKKEVLGAAKQDSNQQAQFRMEDLSEDPELQRLHADRIAHLKTEREKRAVMQTIGHGSYMEIVEADFLEITTKTPMVVCHFFAREFERCKIMDKHLEILARKHFPTRFIKLSAQDAPFFSVKLKIKMLPSVLCFVDGVLVHTIIGFEPLGATDDFTTATLEDLLMQTGAVEPIAVTEAVEDGPDAANKNIRRSLHYSKTESDEDSDFEG